MSIRSVTRFKLPRQPRSRAARIMLSAGLVLLTTMTFVGGPRADDRGSWFRSLRQPVTGMSCCDVSDCRRTEADWHGGQWWAKVEDNWTPIPPDKELQKKSIDGDAYVCSGPRGTVYCFVPPAMAM